MVAVGCSRVNGLEWGSGAGMAATGIRYGTMTTGTVDRRASVFGTPKVKRRSLPTTITTVREASPSSASLWAVSSSCSAGAPQVPRLVFFFQKRADVVVELGRCRAEAIFYVGGGLRRFLIPARIGGDVDDLDPPVPVPENPPGGRQCSPGWIGSLVPDNKHQ
jgi:hypothetical protein